MADLPRVPKPGKGWEHNPKVLLGGGAAAAVVAFALIKRNSAAAAGDPGTTTSGTATYDSTATDQYNGIADQLYALQQQIGTITQGTTGVAGGTTPGGTTTPTPVIAPPKAGPTVPTPGGLKTTPPPFRAKPGAASLSTVTVSHGQTLSGIAKSHGETLATLLKDNPVYTTVAKYQGGNKIWAGDKVRVR